MVKCIAINFGYVESAQLGGLIFVLQGDVPAPEEPDDTDSGIEDPKKALSSLANGLYARYLERTARVSSYKKAKKCCRDFSLQKEFLFCPKCSTRLREPFDLQNYIDWLRSLPVKTADEFGADVFDEAEAWSPWGDLSILRKFKDSDILYINECGESILVMSSTNLKDDSPNILDDDMDNRIVLGYIPEEYVKLLPTELWKE